MVSAVAQVDAFDLNGYEKTLPSADGFCELVPEVCVWPIGLPGIAPCPKAVYDLGVVNVDGPVAVVARVAAMNAESSARPTVCCSPISGPDQAAMAVHSSTAAWGTERPVLTRSTTDQAARFRRGEAE